MISGAGGRVVARRLAEKLLAHRIARLPTADLIVLRDPVNAIALAPVDEFGRDTDLFLHRRMPAAYMLLISRSGQFEAKFGVRALETSHGT